IPSRRHSSAMLSSPRKPVSTMRIFSSAENCRRVARRISFTTCSAGSFTGPDFCPICAPSMATMGQKSSLPQLTRSVSVVLMPDSHDTIRIVPGLEDLGIRMLLNECLPVSRGGDRIHLAGIDDAHFFRVDNIE